MSWFTDTFSSSLGKKLIMALTGIFLITFLIEHLIGNILLVTDISGVAFNEYAHFMKHNILVQIGEVVLFGGFIFHIVDGIILTNKNRKARPIGYVVKSKSETYSWTSKLMGPFGIILLVFLILHLNNFFRYKYFPGNVIENIPGTDVPDMAKLVYVAFTNPLEVIIYMVAMAVVGFHLYHGFQSAFQTLGLNHKKYTPAIRVLGTLYSIFVPLGLASIPIIIYIKLG